MKFIERHFQIAIRNRSQAEPMLSLASTATANWAALIYSEMQLLHSRNTAAARDGGVNGRAQLFTQNLRLPVSRSRIRNLHAAIEIA